MRSRALSFLLISTLVLFGCDRAKKREDVLRQDLFTLRHSIDQYTLDKQKAPESLDELVSAGYLRIIPKDPITGTPDWVPVKGSSSKSVRHAAPGIVDVHSASRGTARDGTAYSSW
jgi:general secretion pathway protein G